MKKTLIALAAVAAATAASAQVTVSGELGFGYRQDSRSDGLITQTDGGLTFAAKEDLGGGLTLSASQTIALEGATGSVGNDGMTLELKGAFGSLKYWRTDTNEDALGVGSLPYDFGDALAADKDDVTYAMWTLPALVPNLTAAIRVSNSGVAGSSGDLRTALLNDKGVPQLRLGYKMGDYGVRLNATTTATEAFFDANVAGATVTLFADLDKKDNKDTEVSVSMPVSSALTLAASYGNRNFASGAGNISGMEFDAQYALSKRTMVRASLGKFQNATAKTSSQVKLYTTF